MAFTNNAINNTLPFASVTGQATLAQLPSIAANTMLANVTNASATPTAVVLPAVRVITQSAHGFSVGQALSLSSSTYILAKADSAADAEVVGIVRTVIDANNFIIQGSGYIPGLSGLTAGTVYFLDPVTGGLLTATQPTTTGQIVKPLLVADSTTSGWLVNYRGQIIATPSNSIKLCGSATLAAGTAIVSTALATVTCKIFLTTITGGSSVGFLKYAISAGVSFTVTSSNISDTSPFSYLIVEP